MEKMQLEETAAALGRAGAFGGSTFKKPAATPESTKSPATKSGSPGGTTSINNPLADYLPPTDDPN